MKNSILTVPWPQRSGMGPSEFVEGEAEVLAGVLQIWFGERDAPLFPVVCIELR